MLLDAFFCRYCDKFVPVLENLFSDVLDSMTDDERDTYLSIN